MKTTDIADRTATRWVLDAAHSSAEFRVPNFWGLVTLKGRFELLDG
jgi:polyisoprenoid-binding protein YceI